MAHFPITFNALAIRGPGASVSLEQKTITALADDEALVRISYASINKMDPMLARQNIFNLPTPYVLGFDFSGEVVALGNSDTEFKPGDQVFGRLLKGGGYAEYAVAKIEHLLPRHEVPAAEASTFGIAYMTAYECLVATGDIARHKGKWIYIAGAGGGLGHFAVQIAKIFGLRVIGSAGKLATLDLLQKMRVDHIIDYSKQDLVAEIMKFTDGRGADVVFDSTNAQASYNQSVRVIARGGEYIRLGTPAQLKQFGLEDLTPEIEARGGKMVVGDAGRYGVDPVYVAQRSKLMDGLKLAVKWSEEGKLRTHITSTVPFDASALQHAFDEFVRGTNNFGKVVVKCG